MTKQPDKEVTETDISEFIRSRDDFAFERRVFNTVVGAGLNAEHAGLYEDPVTMKPRQFDIRARKTVGAKGYRCTIDLTIECKALTPKFPLLISCVPREKEETYHDILTTAFGMNSGAYRHHGLYSLGEYVGKSMRQVGKTKKDDLFGGDEVFDKWMQALASAGEVITEEADRIGRRSDGPAAEFVVVIPILVVSDGTLWLAKYQADGSLDGAPARGDEVTFYLGRKYRLARQNFVFTISHLHVCTETRFSALLAEIAGGGSIWPKLMPL